MGEREPWNGICRRGNVRDRRKNKGDRRMKVIPPFYLMMWKVGKVIGFALLAVFLLLIVEPGFLPRDTLIQIALMLAISLYLCISLPISHGVVFWSDRRDNMKKDRRDPKVPDRRTRPW